MSTFMQVYKFSKPKIAMKMIGVGGGGTHLFSNGQGMWVYRVHNFLRQFCKIKRYLPADGDYY